VFQLAHIANNIIGIPAKLVVSAGRRKRGQPVVNLGHVSVKLRIGRISAKLADVPAPGAIVNKIDQVPPGILRAGHKQLY